MSDLAPRLAFQVTGAIPTTTTEAIILNPRLITRASLPNNAATGGSPTTVITAGGLTADQYKGYLIKITSGPAAGNVRVISTNDTTTYTINSAAAGTPVFTAAVANTNTFEVYAPPNQRPVVNLAILSIVTAGAAASNLALNSFGAVVGSAGSNRALITINLGTVDTKNLLNDRDVPVKGSNNGFLSLAASVGSAAGFYTISGYWEHTSEGDVVTS